MKRRPFIGAMAAMGGSRITTGTSSDEKQPIARPVVDVTDYGARPGDNSDDTRAYNAAVAMVAMQGGGCVRLPAGQLHFASNPDYSPLYADPENGDYSLADGIGGFATVGAGRGATTVRVSGDGWKTAVPHLNRETIPGPLTFADFTVELDTPTGGLLWGARDSTFRGLEITGDANEKPCLHGQNYSSLWSDIWIHDVENIGYGGAFDVRHHDTLYNGVVIERVNKSGWWHNGSQRCTHLACRVNGADQGIWGEEQGVPTIENSVIGGRYENLQRRGIGYCKRVLGVEIRNYAQLSGSWAPIVLAESGGVVAYNNWSPVRNVVVKEPNCRLELPSGASVDSSAPSGSTQVVSYESI